MGDWEKLPAPGFSPACCSGCLGSKPKDIEIKMKEPHGHFQCASHSAHTCQDVLIDLFEGQNGDKSQDLARWEPAAWSSNLLSQMAAGTQGLGASSASQVYKWKLDPK